MISILWRIAEREKNTFLEERGEGKYGFWTATNTLAVPCFLFSLFKPPPHPP
jgi:hypothetical protein